MDIHLTEREMHVDQIGALFKASALISDHVTRSRQAHLNRHVDLGQGLKGTVVDINYKTITIKDSNGERRNVPMTSKRSIILGTQPPAAATTTRK